MTLPVELLWILTFSLNVHLSIEYLLSVSCGHSSRKEGHNGELLGTISHLTAVRLGQYGLGKKLRFLPMKVNTTFEKPFLFSLEGSLFTD